MTPRPTHADSRYKASGGDEPARPPIAGADLWTAVVAAADGHCQCRGECGRSHHKDPDGRCAATNTAARPLHAVPTVVVSVARAVTLPAEQHRAYCPPCHHGLALRTARRQREQHDHRPGDALF